MKTRNFCCAALSVLLFGQQGDAGENVLKSSVAGSWYPADAGELKAQLDGFLAKAGEVKRNESVIGLIMPHAGYQYSGQTAAYSVKALTPKYRTVVVVGPTHRLPMSNMFSVPQFDSYETPLGKVEFDKEFISSLLKDPLFKDEPGAVTGEHSVQMEVPLLQLVLKDFKLVFIVAGQCSPGTVARAAKTLRSVMRDDVLLVASSDFIHCGERFDYQPFKENTEDAVKKIDMEAFSFISKLDADGFLGYVRSSGATICGADPIALLISAVPANSKVELLRHTDSGVVTGDRSNTVSYVAAALAGSWKDAAAVESAAPAAKEDVQAGGLGEADKKTLLKLARKTIEYYLGLKQKPDPKALGIEIGDKLKEERAAFVTLRKKNGELRGCIGEIFPSQALYGSVIDNAINAAVGDPRFQRVEKGELASIKIEISALTVPKKIASYKDIRLGVDGVVLKKKFNRAVYLPQVATETGWKLEEFLANLAAKAGLPPESWKDGCEFLTFQAEVFGEED